MKNPLSKPLTKRLLTALEHLEYKPYFDYSGRCMFGSTCFGIVVPGHKSSFTVASEIYRELLEDEDTTINDITEYTEVFQSANEDSMGRDGIVYFPSLQIEEPEDNEVEYEDDEENN